MRWDIINYLVDQNNYKRYLEVGVQEYNSNCAKINAEYKYAVDPAPTGYCDYIGTSDSYFASIDDTTMFDIIFIDGLHHSEQVLKDIENSLNHLNEGGVIVVHDCLPTIEKDQVRDNHGGAWTGDVWKSIAVLKGTREDLDIKVVDHDWGCGIVKKGAQTLTEFKDIDSLDWNTYVSHRNGMLGVISFEDFINDYKNEQA